ncbi:MAG: hypothetical protein ACM3Q4_03060 [Acidobacteriota bacterium]
MRRYIFLAAALLAFTGTLNTTSYAAKAAYCKTAFLQCASDCGNGWFGEPCRLGCGIGYLFC